MSLKQLRDLGVLLPHEEWGAHDLRTTVNKRALGATTALGVAGLALMYVGNGGASASWEWDCSSASWA